MRRYLVLFLIALVYSQYVPDPATWRPIDGNGHNPNFVKYGATNIQLRRKGSASYGDGISSPRLAKSGRPLPSPRLISDQVFRTSLDGVNPASRRGLTDFVTYWGQFIDHDFGLTGGPKGAAVPPQPLNIPVPLGDQYYDVNGYGNQSLPFYRSVYDVNTGISTPRQQVNLVTAWMDGSQVYGSDLDTANNLRLGVGGLLKSQMYQGAEYPPFNDGAIVMQNDARYANNTQLFSFGDVRGNENPGLTSLQILFLREHNRKAREYASLNPTWSDEQLYQEARKFVIALIQHITEEEYIPVTLGEHLQEFQGYNSSVAPDIYTEFSTGAFRYGHSEVNSWLYRLDSGHHPIIQGHLRLFSNYFNSQSAIQSAGIEPILRGMAQQSQGAVDVIFVDDLKNFLNGLPGSGGSDLISINTQRGRDHGLPGINDYRASYGLKPYVHWAEINPDARIWQSLSNTYESIDDCDVYVCGLAEVPFNYLSNLGETFFTAVSYQYDQIKNGDRFWYEADGYLSEATLTEVRKTTLAELIVRNTNIQKDELQCFVMALPDGCGASVSPPIGLNYDFLVTLQPKTPASPLFGLENDFGFAINGLEGPTLVLQRGKTYTFYAQVSCNHAFLISTTPDVGEGDNLPYENSVNNLACVNQNPLVSLIIDDKTPSKLYYMCGIHSWMGGNITVLDAPVVSASQSNNYVYIAVPEFKYDIGPSVALAVLIPVAIIIILALCVVYVRERRRQRLIAAENQLRGTVTLDEIKG